MLKHIKPTSNGLRHKILIKNKTEHLKVKHLSIIKKKGGGRNHTGKITTRHIGGGHKQRIKLIDHLGEIGAYTTSTVTNFIYDSNRNNYLMQCKTKNNKNFLRLAINNIKIGDLIYGKNKPNKIITNGTISNLQNLPVGLKISNLQIQKYNNLGLITSAGTCGLIIKQEKKQTTIKLPSKKLINLSTSLLCTVGSNANENFNNTNIGKAGAKRWVGIRPTVRGEAMNAIDHPHGGKTSGGVRLKTFYGKLAKFIKKT